MTKISVDICFFICFFRPPSKDHNDRDKLFLQLNLFLTNIIYNQTAFPIVKNDQEEL